MTIDEMIKRLTRLRNKSPLGGNTVVVVCLRGSGVPYCEPTSVSLETDATMVNSEGTFEPNGLARLDVPRKNHEVRP